MGVYDRLAEAIRARIAVGVATVLDGEHIGAKMLVFPDGRREGSLGLGTLDARIVDDVRAAVRASRSGSRTYPLAEAGPGFAPDGSVQVYLEAHTPPPELVIVGAGHTSIPLAAYGRIAGFKVILIDARSAFANRARFPDVDELLVEWPHIALSRRPIGESTYVAVLTHDAKFEEPLLPVLLRSEARYIGVIGSRKTQIQRRERLRGEGFSDDDLKRLSGPIGLDIGAVTPEEIALSILAEMVARQHGRPAGFLSDRLAASLE